MESVPLCLLNISWWSHSLYLNEWFSTRFLLTSSLRKNQVKYACWLSTLDNAGRKRDMMKNQRSSALIQVKHAGGWCHIATMRMNRTQSSIQIALVARETMFRGNFPLFFWPWLCGKWKMVRKKGMVGNCGEKKNCSWSHYHTDLRVASVWYRENEEKKARKTKEKQGK